ncbi:MAG: hypothetical protein HRU19_24900 [Pseudobacteriovorax sp.]|nr:hypothetical protein [Pseudobacteriovorax sp.]
MSLTNSLITVIANILSTIIDGSNKGSMTVLEQIWDQLAYLAIWLLGALFLSAFIYINRLKFRLLQKKSNTIIAIIVVNLVFSTVYAELNYLFSSKLREFHFKWAYAAQLTDSSIVRDYEKRIRFVPSITTVEEVDHIKKSKPNIKKQRKIFEKAIEKKLSKASKALRDAIKMIDIYFVVDQPYDQDILINHCRMFRHRLLRSQECIYYFDNKKLAEDSLGIVIANEAWEHNEKALIYCYVYLNNKNMDDILCFGENYRSVSPNSNFE